MTVAEILNRFKPKEVEFTGGEPATNFPLLLESIRIARQFSGYVMVNTNMELLTGERIQEMEESGLTHLHFALHALDAELHKQVRGSRLADIEKVLQNIVFVLDNTKIKIVVEFVPMKINMYEFSKVYEYVRKLREKYGDRVVELEVGRLIPKGRARKEMASSTEDLMPIFESIGRPVYLVEVFCFGKKAGKELEAMGFKKYPCDAGSGMFYFEIDGRVLADNFSGVEISGDFRRFDPEKYEGFYCPYR